MPARPRAGPADAVRAEDGDARGVVAAVLELLQAVDDDVAPRSCRRRSRRFRTWTSSFFRGRLRSASRARLRAAQPSFTACCAPLDGERAGRHVLGDVEPAPTYAPSPMVTGATRLRVRADEGAVLDGRLVLVEAVVVARDRAGADVDAARRSSASPRYAR